MDIVIRHRTRRHAHAPSNDSSLVAIDGSLATHVRRPDPDGLEVIGATGQPILDMAEAIGLVANPDLEQPQPLAMFVTIAHMVGERGRIPRYDVPAAATWIALCNGIPVGPCDLTLRPADETTTRPRRERKQGGRRRIAAVVTPKELDHHARDLTRTTAPRHRGRTPRHRDGHIGHGDLRSASASTVIRLATTTRDHRHDSETQDPHTPPRLTSESTDPVQRSGKSSQHSLDCSYG